MSFDEVFQTVTDSICTHGMLPVENSLAGSIHRNYDLMNRHDLCIVGEYHFRVSHCLLALDGVKIEHIKRVYSHPQALAQCEANLSRMGVERIPYKDTAGSARLISEGDDRQAAALASAWAAEVYNLTTLSEHMEDNPANLTRFLAFTRKANGDDPIEGIEYKTSIVFSLHNKPGALFKALSVFALRDIDLTKIESRPVPGQPWEYLFYIDFAGHVKAQTSQRALDHLSELAPFIRVLGTYPRHDYTKGT
jgi:prephenate dehydratase